MIVSETKSTCENITYHPKFFVDGFERIRVQIIIDDKLGDKRSQTFYNLKYVNRLQLSSYEAIPTE